MEGGTSYKLDSKVSADGDFELRTGDYTSTKTFNLGGGGLLGSRMSLKDGRTWLLIATVVTVGAVLMTKRRRK